MNTSQVGALAPGGPGHFAITWPGWGRTILCQALAALFWLMAPATQAVADTFSITSAEWRSDDGGRLAVEGHGRDGRTVTVRNAGNGEVLGTDQVNDNQWRERTRRPAQVPCRVRAEQSGSGSSPIERDVRNRPANCGPVAGATPSLSIASVTVAEGATANFAVTLSAASAQTVSVVVNTANGTAVAPGDFTARSNRTLSFAPGTTVQTFAVVTRADTLAEATENFLVLLSAPSNATLAVAQGVGTLTNVGQTGGTPALSINSVSAPEGDLATFTVSLSAPGTQVVTVLVNTANGSAVVPGDFVARNAVTLSFPIGTTSQAFTVSTLADALVEGNEIFTVTLSSPTNATIAVAQGVATILDAGTTSAAVAHATMTTYDGPQTCVRCHETQARQMHGSLHYQQNGPTDFVTNIAGNAGEGPAGKPGGSGAALAFNTYCGTHENSPRFACSGCHVGNGRFPLTPTQFTALGAGTQGQLTELANIDCLTCHQQAYKRFPDWTATGAGFGDLKLLNVSLDAAGLLFASPGQSVIRTGLQGIPNVNLVTRDFMYRPSGAAGSLIPLPAGTPLTSMALTTEQAARQVHRTTRQSCLSCHAGAAGADGAKRGDLSTHNAASTDNGLDRHMSSGVGGSNLTCSNCHNANDAAGKTLHRVRGRGLDLRANDMPTRLTCDSAGCHSATPHTSTVASGNTTLATRLNRHAAKVACQTCHIPSYGKGVATELARDWQTPHVAQLACNGRGGWLPEELKSSTAVPPVPVRPTYQWFDGTSQVYFLTEPLTNTPTKPLPAAIATALKMTVGAPAYVMGRPNGALNTAAAKIYPMKEHWGKLARSTASNTLIPQSTFEFFRTGSFCRAVALGMNPTATEAQIDQLCPVQGSPLPSGAQVVPVHTYQTINHGVEPRANALGAATGGTAQCGNCHTQDSASSALSGGPSRMPLRGTGGLGYDLILPATNTGLCVQCHEAKNNPGLIAIHDRSDHRSRGCSACHANIAGR